MPFSLPKNSQQNKKLTAKQLSELIVPIGEARKLLGVSARDLTDEDVALQVLVLHKFAYNIIKSLNLQK